jgi:hypothetical protein
MKTYLEFLLASFTFPWDGQKEQIAIRETTWSMSQIGSQLRRSPGSVPGRDGLWASGRDRGRGPDRIRIPKSDPGVPILGSGMGKSGWPMWVKEDPS